MAFNWSGGQGSILADEVRRRLCYRVRWMAVGPFIAYVCLLSCSTQHHPESMRGVLHVRRAHYPTHPCMQQQMGLGKTVQTVAFVHALVVRSGACALQMIG